MADQELQERVQPATAEDTNGSAGGEEAPEDEYDELISCTLSELVPGAAIRNLLVQVIQVKSAGEAIVESAHGRCTLMYDPEKLFSLIRPQTVLKIVDGFGWTEENGRLVLRLEDPEEESVLVETNVDPEELTAPDEYAQNDVSSVNRVYGILAIREDMCLLCPAGLTEGKWSFPVNEAYGDEPERTAALRAFQSLTEIDVNEIYILNEACPIMSYEEEYVATLFIAYSRRPFSKRSDVTKHENEAYSWFTFDEAYDALETEGSQSCLLRAQQALDAAIASGFVRKSYGATFGPTPTKPIAADTDPRN